MKFVSFINDNNEERLGFYFSDKIIDLAQAASQLNLELPAKMNLFLAESTKNLEIAQQVEKACKNSEIFAEAKVKQMLAPVPQPPSCRDGYAFRQHVATARRNRGVEMIPEFDQYPVFYFTNHNAIIGEGNLVVEKDHFCKLDFELEAAVVIGKKGRNIHSEQADEYIFGYLIMNDFSARELQMDEMKLNLGPAKGKDFATAIGPWLVTVDELEKYKIVTPEGNKYNLEMKAFHNGKQISAGNLQDMNWTFAEIVERCSYGADILPGDVIGSGTVGTGCYLELNGTAALIAKEKGENFQPVWLQEGDEIVLEITGLGTLKNNVVFTGNDFSLLAKKKNV